MTQIKKLTGMLLYVMCDQPTDCYEAAKGQEWKASVVVDEDTADTFAEAYPKQSAKKIKRTEFEKEYKVAPPEGDEKNLYVITLKKNTKVKDRTSGGLVPISEKYHPIVYEQTEDEDGKRVRIDVTHTKLPANGSYGSVSIFHKENTEYGNSAGLQDVLVTEMIEFERKASNPADRASAFDDDEDDVPAPKAKAPAKAPAKTPAKAPAKKAPKAETKEVPEAGGDDDSDPF